MAFVAVAAIVMWAMSLWWMVSALRNPRGLIRAIRRVVAAAICAGVGLLLSALLVLLRVGDAFTERTLVAQVATRRLSAEEFELTYQPARGGHASPIQMRLRGDQWSISGGIVKWHPWLTTLGLKSYHKPMRLSGQFSRVAQQQAQRPTVYPLAPDLDLIWQVWYRAAPLLPFVEAAYGSSAFVYVEPQMIHEVYVTPSGYLITRRAKPSAAVPPPAPVLG